MEYLIAKKVGMTQLFSEAGSLLPVTLVLLANKDQLINVKSSAKLTVTGNSKGKGFQGVVKRHGFRGAPKSHGRKHDWRRPGSIGSSFPERVVKGRKMPGHMGSKTITIKNLEVVRIDQENKLIAIKGAIPGAVGSVVRIAY